jgi:hypothetical protein
MDPLQRILDLATNHGTLSSLPEETARWRTLLYADDVAILLNPVRQDMQAVVEILQAFGHFSGLRINLEKGSVHPIRCEDIELDHVLEPFNGIIESFPCRYLGLQLHTRPLKKVHVQPLIERIAHRLPGWKGKWLNRAGRLTLVSSVLSSIPTYHLTVFPLAVWARKRIDRIRRSFLWKGEENANGGHCLVNWATVTRPKDLGIDRIRRSFLWKGEENANGGHCLVNWATVTRPKDLGGLGIPDLDKFGRALHLRWLWQEWVDDTKPWAGIDTPTDGTDQALFTTSTRVVVGDGHRCRFWHDAWLDGEAPCHLAPSLFVISRTKNGSVFMELRDNHWINALRGRITTATQMQEFVSLWVKT